MTAWILAAGPSDGTDFYRSLRPAVDDIIIAADGGYGHALELGWTPDVVIGDLDSCKHDIPPDILTIRHNPDKDKTDLHLCVDYALEHNCTGITLLFAFGGRIDHSLAAVMMLRYIAEWGGKRADGMAARGKILCRNSEVTLITERASLPRGEYIRLSLIPLTGTVTGVTARGVKYPLNGATLYQSQSLGISNEFVDSHAEITIRQGLLIAVMERSD